MVSLFNLEKGHNCKTIQNVKIDVTVKHKSPKNSSHGEMARHIARVELIATISLWTIFYNNPCQMTYWLFEIALINLCNKYYVHQLKYVWCIYVYSNRSIQIMFEHFCYRFLSCTCSVWAVKKHWLVKCLLSTVTDQDITFSGTWFMLSYDNKW